MKNILFIIALAVIFSSCNQPKKSPNIVFILTDQWRSTALGYAGNDVVKTPCLDEFAKEAINFGNAVSVCPVCTPYRASLMTGQYPTTNGVFVNDVHMPAERLCMAEIFNEAGYNTAYLGKWHLNGKGRTVNVEPEDRQGWKFWKGLECSHNYLKMPYYANDDPEMKIWEEYSPFAISKEAQKYVGNHAQDESPFVLFVSIATPHFPHHNTVQKYRDMYPISSLKLRDNVPEELHPQVLKELQGYYAHCSATDKAIGDILDKIKAEGIDDNTIIVFTSDHGEMMGSHGRKPYRKQLAWDESSKIPFLISFPGMTEESKGYTSEVPITTPEILPSLLSLSGIEIPSTIDGKDVAEIIKNPQAFDDRAALFMNVSPFGVNYDDPQFRAVRTKQFTYAEDPNGPIMLFDNVADPLQLNNLVDVDVHASLQKELKAKLDEELTRIGDINFKPREYYLDLWGLKYSERHIIDYHFPKGVEHVVQTPRRKK